MKPIDIFPWDDHFNVGISDIDQQHRRLVELLNELAREVVLESEFSRLGVIFDELLDYTIYHFQTEEVIWSNYFPNDSMQEQHISVHKNFIDTILRLKEEQNSRSTVEIAQETLGFLARWLASHILETDRLMAYIVISLQAGMDMEVAKKQAEVDMSGFTRTLIDLILSIYEKLSTNTLQLMSEVRNYKELEFSSIENNNLLQSIIQTVPLRIFWKDRDLKYLGCNDLFAQDAGFKNAEQMIGKSDFETGCKDQAELYRGDDFQVMESGIPKLGFEEPQTTPDGSLIWLRTSKVPLIDPSTGETIGILGVYDDISEKKKMETKLRQKELYQRALLDNFPHLVWLKDTEGRFLIANRPLALAAGFENTEEMLGVTDFDVFPKDLAEAYRADDNEVLKSGTAVEREEEISSQGTRTWVETYKAPIVNEEGIVFGTVGFARDISQRKEMELQLQHIAHYDLLTGLPNRVLKSDRLRQAMIHAERRNEKIAVIYLDLDGFKHVNDRYGHSIGDELLIALSGRMKQALREGDTLSRLGGDEFVAILVDMDDTSSSLPIVQRLLDAASQSVELDDIAVQVSASIGVTFYPQHEDVDADQLIRQADQAMYEAKQSGKNRYHIFDSEHDRTIRVRHEYFERIQQALDSDEFVLYYQPKINMRTGELIGAEALIRWQHPSEGLIPPLEFLPIIENHPLSIKIGEWVINEAISQIKQWQTQGLNLLVSINVGAKQLLQGNFVQRLQWILSQHENFDSSSLKIEILETSALENIDQAAKIIQECKEMGIHFALDDFGTGYSSLTYLKRLPIITLKIDQSFVRDMLENRDDLAILEGIIGLAKAFGREVIAEGVETNEHGKQLLLLGCDLAQGYGIARPMPAEKLTEWAGKWYKDHEWIV